MALGELLEVGQRFLPQYVQSGWGHRAVPEMLWVENSSGEEEFLMEAVTVPKLESNWVCQQVAVVCDCG